MAKVWCYVLDAQGVTGLTSFDGSEVGTPLNKHLYECEDDNVDLAQDGTGKLYHAANDKIDATDLQNALNVYYGAPVPTHLVQIRYYTTTSDIENAGIVAEGGTAEIIKIEDGIYDLVSDDPLTFVALLADGYNYYWYNSYMEVTKIEVISGYTLTRFYDDSLTAATFAHFVLEGMYWLDTVKNYPTDLTLMFTLCELDTIDLGTFNTSEVTTMEQMFKEAVIQNGLDVSSFDVSKVENFRETFFLSLPNQDELDLSSWVTSSINTTDLMFNGATFTPIFGSGWDLTTLVNADSMFRGMTVESLDLTYLDFSNASDIGYMFEDSGSLKCITNINTTGATNRINMFDNTGSLVQPDAAAIIDITDVDGANWVNPNPCPAVV